MRKIWTRSVFIFDKKSNTFILDESDSEFYFIEDDAPIAQMKGGGGTVPNLRDPLRRAGDIYGNRTAENSIAPFSPDTLEARRMMEERARSGNPMIGAGGSATDMLNRTLRGDYLTGGAGFDAALKAASNKITPMYDSAFEKGGRGASGLLSTGKQAATADAFAGLYEQERQNQLRAAGMAPDIAKADYLDPSVLGQVGAQGEARDQQRLDFPKNNVNEWLSTLGQFAKQPENKGWVDWLSGAAGGALAGYSVGGPWGAAAGSGLGLLGSLK